jgi:hypothetical protein
LGIEGLAFGVRVGVWGFGIVGFRSSGFRISGEVGGWRGPTFPTFHALGGGGNPHSLTCIPQPQKVGESSRGFEFTALRDLLGFRVEFGVWGLGFGVEL